VTSKGEHRGKGVLERGVALSDSLSRLRLRGWQRHLASMLMPNRCMYVRCFYFDGPGYSAFPNESMTLDTRWISFTTTVNR
jgi:hypothetical protein